jgi:hypothetical protein
MNDNKENETIIPDDLTVNNILNTNQKIDWVANSMVILGLFILVAGTILFIKAYVSYNPFMIVAQNHEDKKYQLLNYFASLMFIMSITIILLIVPYINCFSLLNIKKIKIAILLISIWLMFCSLFLYYCEYQSKDNWWEYCATVTLGGYFVFGAISEFLSAKLKRIFNNSSLVLFLLFILFCILSGSSFLPINI